MTAGELIEELRKLHPDLMVEIEGCCHIFDAEHVAVATTSFNTVYPGTVLIEHRHDLLGVG